jgi:RNA polymerase sigma factor (sigma-70 family)
MPQTQADQDRLFELVMTQYAGALTRLASGYEANAELRRDLLQDIQIAMWRSFAAFDGRCSLSTWVYRVAHNRGLTHMMQQRRRANRRLCNIEELELEAREPNPEIAASEQRALAMIRRIIEALNPPDRQILLLYLEDTGTAEIAEITGVSANAVATKIHRFKALLARRFGENGDEQ